MYEMKAQALAVSTANVENAGEIEMEILGDQTLMPFRKVDDFEQVGHQWVPRSIPIGEFYQNTNACNRGIIKQKVISICHNTNRPAPTLVDMIITGQNVHRTSSILLCFLFKVLMIISEQESQIILSKVTFYDPNERLLWDSAGFR